MSLRFVRSFITKGCVPAGFRRAQAACGSESSSSSLIQVALGSARGGKFSQFTALRNMNSQIRVSPVPLSKFKSAPSGLIVGITTVCAFSASVFLNSKQASSSTSPEIEDKNEGAIPERIAWDERGVLNAPRLQGRCGCCWAIVVIASLEAAWMIKYGELLKLSVQELIDCAGDDGSMQERAQGCEGRKFPPALEYLVRYGICSEEDYKRRRRWYGFLGNDGPCLRYDKHFIGRVKKAAYASDWGWCDPGEAALMKGVAQQPLCVVVDRSTKVVRGFRGGGVIEYEMWPPSEDPNEDGHAVLLLGYDGNKDGKVWKIMNTWGPEWGDDSKAFLRRGVEDERGTAGINRYFSFYPILH